MANWYRALVFRLLMICLPVLGLLTTCVLSESARGDWPTYRQNNARYAMTAETPRCRWWKAWRSNRSLVRSPPGKNPTRARSADGITTWNCSASTSTTPSTWRPAGWGGLLRLFGRREGRLARHDEGPGSMGFHDRRARPTGADRLARKRLCGYGQRVRLVPERGRRHSEVEVSSGPEVCLLARFDGHGEARFNKEWNTHFRLLDGGVEANGEGNTVTRDYRDDSNGSPRTSRRSLLRQGAVLTAGALLNSAIAHLVHAAGDETIKVALVGCGSRGTGAASQVLKTAGPIKLWAMADLFEDRLDVSLANLTKGQEADYDREAHGGFAKKIDVTPERRFVGFEAYKQAIDTCLWAKGAHPVAAQGQGGRQFRVETQCGDTFDHHFVEYGRWAQEDHGVVWFKMAGHRL